MSGSIAEMMSVDFAAVTEQMSLTDALALLIDSEATELCVVDEQGRFQGVITDFDLLKVCLSGRFQDESIKSLISRAVTIVPVNTPLRQIVPLFRDGVCSRAYVCCDGRIVGKITRSQILRLSAGRHAETNTSSETRSHETLAIHSLGEKRMHEASPQAPRFVTSSFFSNVTVERSSFRARPSA